MMKMKAVLSAVLVVLGGCHGINDRGLFDDVAMGQPDGGHVASASTSSISSSGTGGTASATGGASGSGGAGGGEETDAGSDAAITDAPAEAGVCGGDLCQAGPARSTSCVCVGLDATCACVSLICENAPECCGLVFLGDGGWGPGGPGTWSAGCVAKLPDYCGLCLDGG